ncbi:MAG: NAD(P)/FAD-dependent oxidoreductase [Bacteroidales bacterium]|nr:NAD(P)/FAD-dependent oxidoreductase [Bacteroidales bacterium]MBR0029186.1 NAD(P)/FAD-dependent oxidoreductase [Bacteroidales bacterium]
MKSLTVIGAGISGLTCAIYAQRSGFRTVILEKAGGPGGVSTGWKRKGYTFEGGIHWLIGSRPGLPLHDVWTETGALGAGNPVWCFTFFHTPILDKGGLKVRHPRRFSLPEFLKMGRPCF